MNVPLDEVQGLIFRGYGCLNTVRHLVLEVTGPNDARKFLGSMARRDTTSQWPITTVSAWDKQKHDAAINVGFTRRGLATLCNGTSLANGFAKELVPFNDDFGLGARERAASIGDTEDSGPEHWKSGLGEDRAHIVLSLFEIEDSEKRCNDICSELDSHGMRLLSTPPLKGNRLGEGKVHFGYKDGISQPYVKDISKVSSTHNEEPVPVCQFLVRNDSEAIYKKRYPDDFELLLNGGFAAFRVLKQEVGEFENFLNRTENALGIDKELLAAKLCGRWRTGTPLAKYPNDPLGEVEDNNFDYVTEFDDPMGKRCPLGAHIRRTNPRSTSPVKGLPVSARRLIRHGFPYGPRFDPNKPDEAERGLLGLFFGVPLAQTFEAVMQSWVHEGGFMRHLPTGDVDPLVGNHNDPDSKFEFPHKGDVLRINGFSRFVKTRGSAYLLYPSTSTLRRIGEI